MENDRERGTETERAGYKLSLLIIFFMFITTTTIAANSINTINYDSNLQNSLFSYNFRFVAPLPLPCNRT